MWKRRGYHLSLCIAEEPGQSPVKFGGEVVDVHAQAGGVREPRRRMSAGCSAAAVITSRWGSASCCALGFAWARDAVRLRARQIPARVEAGWRGGSWPRAIWERGQREEHTATSAGIRPASTGPDGLRRLRLRLRQQTAPAVHAARADRTAKAVSAALGVLRSGER